MDNEILEFEELFGFAFGTHYKKKVTIPGRKAIIHVRTGTKSEDDVRFILGTGIPGWGTPMAGIFADTPDATEGLDFKTGMYMTQDGVDPRSLKKTGSPYIPRVPRENAALRPNTDYYLQVWVTKQGHESWIPQMSITYAGTDYPEEYEIDAQGNPVGQIDITIAGYEGTWFPKKSS